MTVNITAAGALAVGFLVIDRRIFVARLYVQVFHRKGREGRKGKTRKPKTKKTKY